MKEEPDYIIDISGTENTPADADSTVEANICALKASGRPYISVYFQCCRVYHRIYRNRPSTAYEGRCPRCMKPVRVRIGRQGTSCRFFTAT